MVDLDFLIRKLERRLILGPSYTPTMAEVDLLVTVMGYVEILDEDELLRADCRQLRNRVAANLRSIEDCRLFTDERG